MKKLILILLAVLFLLTDHAISQEYTNEEIEFDVDYEYVQRDTLLNEFKDGWEDGYCEGWKDINGRYAKCPKPPRVPKPRPGLYLYKDGYNRGFKQGFMDAKRANEFERRKR